MLLLLTNAPARVYAGGIAPGGFVNGPTVRVTTGPPPVPYTPRLTLEVLERDGTFVCDLPLSFGRRFTRNLDGTGTGQFSIGMDDADAAQVIYGRLGRFFIDDQARLTILLAAIDKVEVAKGEEVDQIISVVGPSWFSLLDEAVVAPGPGSPVDNPDIRSFGLSSPAGTGTVTVNGTPTPGSTIMPEPDPGPWPSPIAVDDTPPTPVNFPVDIPAEPDVPPAQWVTAAPILSTDPLYLSQTFTVAEADTVTLVNVGTSGPATVSVDGVLVATPDGAPRAMFTAALPGLDVGEHSLVVIVSPPPDIFEPAAITRVSQLDPAGRHAITLTTSNPSGPSSTIGAVRSPIPPTTITAGRVVAVLIAEGLGRGCFPGLTIGFDGVVDSAGNAWTPIVEFTVDVGTDTVASVAKKLTEAGYGWFRMAPGQLRLDGYATLPDTAVGTLAAGVDLEELKHEGTG